MAPKKKKAVDAPKWAALFPQPSRPRPVVAVPPTVVAGSRPGTTGLDSPPPRSPPQFDTAAAIPQSNNFTILEPENVSTALAAPLNDNELDVPSLTENRTVELRDSVEGHLRLSLSRSLAATGMYGAHTVASAGDSGTASPSDSRPASAIGGKRGGGARSSASASRSISQGPSTRPRVSRFTVTDEPLMAMSVKDAVAAGLIPSPAVARAVQVAKTSILRQRIRSLRSNSPASPQAGSSSAPRTPQLPAAVTKDDLLDVGITPAALALCEAHDAACGVVARISSGAMSASEVNLVRIMALYKKVHPNNLLRIHEEISRNMGINTAELAFVEQRLVSDIAKAMDGINKVMDADEETIEAEAIAGSVSVQRRSSVIGSMDLDRSASSNDVSSVQQPPPTVSATVTSGPSGNASPTNKSEKEGPILLEAFLTHPLAQNAKLSVDVVAKLCAKTLGPAMAEHLPPVVLLVLTLYCSSQHDIARLFPSFEGKEADALAEMEHALQEKKKEESIMKAARRVSNSDPNGTAAAAAATDNKAVDGVVEEIRLLQLRRVLLERVKEAEKRKATEYETGFRNTKRSSKVGDMGEDGDGPVGGGDDLLSPQSMMQSPSSPGFGASKGAPSEAVRAEMQALRTPYYRASGQPRPTVSMTRSLEELRMALQTAGVTSVLSGRKLLPTVVPTTNNADVILGKWAGTVAVLVAALHTISSACDAAARAPPPRPQSPFGTSSSKAANSSPSPEGLRRRRATTIRANTPDYKGPPVFKPVPKVNSAALPDPLGIPLGYYLQKAYLRATSMYSSIQVLPPRSLSVAAGSPSSTAARLSLALDTSSVTGSTNVFSTLSAALTSSSSPHRHHPLAASAAAFTGGTSSTAGIALSPFVSPGAGTLAHLAAMVSCVTPSRYLSATVHGWLSASPPLVANGEAILKRGVAAPVPHPAASIPQEKDAIGNNLLSCGYVPLRYRVVCGSPPSALDYLRRASLEAHRGIFTPPLLCPMTANADVLNSTNVLPIQREFGEPIPAVLYDAAAPEEDRLQALFQGWHVDKQPTLAELEAMVAAESRGKQKQGSPPAGGAPAGGADSALLEYKLQAMSAALANAALAATGVVDAKKPQRKAKKTEGPLPMVPEEEEAYLAKLPCFATIEVWVRPDVHALTLSPLFSSRPAEEEFLIAPLLRFRLKRIDVPNLTLQLLVDTSPRHEEQDGSGTLTSFFREVMSDAAKASNTARRLCDRLISEFVPKYHCHRHPSQKYAFFCRTCRALICHGCAREQHASHMVSSLPYFCHQEAVRKHPAIESLLGRVTRLKEIIAALKPKVEALTEVVDKGMLTVEERLRGHLASLHADADERASLQLRQILNEKRRCLEERASILRAKQALLLLQRGATKTVPKPVVPQTYFQINCKLTLTLPSSDILKLIKVLTWSNPSKYLSPVIYPPAEPRTTAVDAIVAARAGGDDEVITVTVAEECPPAAGANMGEDGVLAASQPRSVGTRRIPLTTTGTVAASLAPSGTISIGDERNIRLSVANITARIDALAQQAEEALLAVWSDVTAAAEMRGDIPKVDDSSNPEAFIRVDEADDDDE